jgi:hypothetical protein
VSSRQCNIKTLSTLFYSTYLTQNDNTQPTQQYERDLQGQEENNSGLLAWLGLKAMVSWPWPGKIEAKAKVIGLGLAWPGFGLSHGL